MFLYKRTLNVDLIVHANNTVRAVARLEIGSPTTEEKYLYQIWAELENKEDDVTIVDTGVDFLTGEVPACDGTRVLINKMKGLRLDEKYLWRISGIFARSDGCQHLYELAIEIGRAYSNLKVGEHLRAKRNASSPSTGALVNMKKHCAGLSFLVAQEEL